MNKRGISGVITMLIIVALALVAIGFVWFVINNILSQSTDNVETSASNLFDSFHNPLGGGVDVPEEFVSCAEIYESDSTSENGIYTLYPEETEDSIEVYCDIANGGWTLVLLSNRNPPGCPSPSWDLAINSVSYNGSVLSTDLASFDLLVGLKYWELFGNTIKLEVGASPSSINHRATYDISLDEVNNYKLDLSNQNLIIGTQVPDFYTVHNGMDFSTFDEDNDLWQASYSCSSVTGDSAWWYNSCWGGSFWGRCKGWEQDSLKDAPYWISYSDDNYAHGAMWIK